MRIIRTTRGLLCMQVGRSLDGQLGVLGQDGEFGDDGLFHPLPVAILDEHTCAEPGYFSIDSIVGLPASGAFPNLSIPSCLIPGSKRTNGRPYCPLADERELAFGMLGPDAVSVSYTVNGSVRTFPAVAPNGVYIVALDAPTNTQLYTSGVSSFSGSQGEPRLEGGGPLFAITYRVGKGFCQVGQITSGGPPRCPSSIATSDRSRSK